MIAPPLGSIRAHVWVPLATFVAFALLFEVTSFDLWFADRVFHWEGDAWMLRRDPIVRDVLHNDAKRLIGLIYGLLAVVCGLSFFVARLAKYRWGLVYLVAAIAISTLSVALLKDFTHVSCPWSVDRYGGSTPYQSHWRALTTGHANGRCFPSGHASSAFALLASYFFCRRYAPTLRWYAFGLAMTLGVTFGIAQQLRGAHYLSHDVWALAICWFVAVAATPIMELRSRETGALPR